MQKFLFSLACACCALYGTNLSAEQRSPYRIALSSSGVSRFVLEDAPKAARTDSRLALETVAPLVISGYVPGQGVVKATFATQWKKTWKSYITDANGNKKEDPAQAYFLRGTATIGRGKNATVVPAAATVYDEGKSYLLQMNFNGRSRATGAVNNRLYQVTSILEGKSLEGAFAKLEARTSGVPASALANAKCGIAKAAGLAETIQQSAPQAATALGAQSRIVEVGTDFDTQWFLIYGNQSNTRIQSIVNQAATIYTNDSILGIGITIKDQNGYETQSSSPYNSNDYDTLLRALENSIRATGTSHLAASDAYHLFSGRDFLDDVVGFAYFRAICQTPALGFGITQDVGSLGLGSVIFAHEIGHNLGACHPDQDECLDPAGDPSLMDATVSAGKNFFSTFSAQQINTFLASNDSCLLDGSVTPPPGTPHAPFVRFSGANTGAGVKFTATVLGDDSQPVAGLSVKLLRNGRVIATKTTNSRGRVSLRVTTRGKYRASTLNSAGATVMSRVIRVV